MANILITGSNRGLGLELARTFAIEGWRVFACCRTPERAAELKALVQEGVDIDIRRLDMTRPEQIKALSQALRDVPLDILLNCAGIFGPRPTELDASDVEGWLTTYHTNSLAPLQMALAFLPQLTSAPKPILASISSTLGSISMNKTGGDYAYRASKAALNMVNKGLSVDLAALGIICVVLHPGWMHTRMGGPQAPLSPRESAAGLKKVLLGLKASDNGRFINYLGESRPW